MSYAARLRMSDAQRRAVQEAIRRVRLRTGDSPTLADIMRDGLRMFVVREGGVWPATDKEST